jgi:hypothetical protein
MTAVVKVYVGLPAFLAELGPQLLHHIIFFTMETSWFENIGVIFRYFDARKSHEYNGLFDNFVTGF